MASNPFQQPQPHGTPNRGTGQNGNLAQPSPAPPPYVDPAFVKGADGLYAGRNGTRTSLPQPFVDMLAPTGQQMPASFGQFLGAGQPLGAPVPAGTAPPPHLAATPKPGGGFGFQMTPAAPTPPAPTGKKKKKKAQAIL